MLGMNVLDESTLHRMHVLMPAKGSNKTFIKKVIFAETPVMRASLISCNSFVKTIVGLNFNYFFYTTLDCTCKLVWKYHFEHDPIILDLYQSFVS